MAANMPRKQETLNSLLSLYQNRESSSRSIIIGLAADTVPSSKQEESLRQQLKEALEVKEVLDNLTKEVAKMQELAALSQGQRTKNQALSRSDNRG